MHSIARDIAVRVLYRVAADQAYAAASLNAEISKARCSPRDAALATQIVYGTLRALAFVDEQIRRHMSRPSTELEPWTHAALRTGTYQIVYLGSSAAHAVVNDSVTIVSKQRGKRMGGFVNAVLRKVVASASSIADKPLWSVPPWIEQEVRRSLGDPRASAFFDSQRLPPWTGLRAETARISRDDLAEKVRSNTREKASVINGALSSRAVLVRGGGDPHVLAGYVEGEFSIQEQGSQRVALMLNAQAGERIADVCAGRGGKTTLLADVVGKNGHITAIDIHEHKLDQLKEEQRRLRIDAARIKTHTVDMTVGVGTLVREYDRVIVDAPCSGLGTLHRRPEIALRISPDSIQALAKTQRAILNNALKLVRTGGTLLYTVCSPLHQEGLEVIADFEGGPPDKVCQLGPWIGLETNPSDRDSYDSDAYQIIQWTVR